MSRRRFDLVVFDLDGTLVEHDEPIWKTLHERLGSDPDRRRQVIGDALAGRIDYAAWFAADLDMLGRAGATRDAILDVVRGLRATPGAVSLLHLLKGHGTRVAILSGAVDLLIDAHLPGVAFDAVHINRVRFDDAGRIAGGEATAYDLERKADGLRALAHEFRVDLSRVAFVGNGDNDLEAAEAAGFAVAWRDAPAALRAVSDVYEPGPDLLDLVPHLIGHDPY
ncbi:MAG: HAD-IB family phosphatase [Myxococcales bacterium]|nr:HAD-IB family phosphatase [Myxococcales bacterium]MCB9736664.1 HAD-IB family phosphatase [Deltaproteobacteria bacterium]